MKFEVVLAQLRLFWWSWRERRKISHVLRKRKLRPKNIAKAGINDNCPGPRSALCAARSLLRGENFHWEKRLGPG